MRPQSNLTTGRIAAAHGRFNGIRQVAPVCTLTLYMFSWAHPSSNPKQHIPIDSAVFAQAQLTAESRIYFTTGRLFSPLKFTKVKFQ